MKIVTVIPAYNVENTITQVVRATKKYCDEVIVVDDGSSDNTPKIIQKLGIKYALCPVNHGQGSATKIGIKMALRLGADVVITLDSDEQHNPNEIPQVLKPILDGMADMVIGARFLNWRSNKYTPKDLGFYSCYEEEYQDNCIKIPRYRKFGIDIINWLYNVCNGKKLIDTQSCFRAYTRWLIQSFSIEEDGFGFSTEVLIKARKMKARMVEVPVSCIYHNLGQDSTMNPLMQGVGVAWKTLYWRLKLWA